MSPKVSLRSCPQETVATCRSGRPKGMMLLSSLENRSPRAGSEMRTGSCVLLSSLSLEEEPWRTKMKTFEKRVPGGWRHRFLYGGMMTSGRSSGRSRSWWRRNQLRQVKEHCHGPTDRNRKPGREEKADQKQGESPLSLPQADISH